MSACGEATRQRRKSPEVVRASAVDLRDARSRSPSVGQFQAFRRVAVVGQLRTGTHAQQQSSERLLGSKR
jgi:hypothetical protein